MVIKGSARGGPRQLANHLLRTDHNETVNVLHMSGIDAPDLHSALREMHAIGEGAQTRRTLYHANIDPRADERLTKEQNHIAVEKLAERLGLADQAYVVVEHVKNGRHHLHVVWSRIDLESMSAISDSHNYRRHEEVARDLERQFGHERVQGAHHERDGVERPSRTATFAEMQQGARAGTTPKQQKEIVTRCWRETETSGEFRQQLEAAGFILARGDRRDLVLIDSAGEVHSLARRIEGANAAEVRQRMSDIKLNDLLGVDEAREKQKQLELKPVVEKGFVSASERLQLEERQRERDGQKAPREQLGGMHGEIADAIYHLKKTMRGQMADTVANSQTEIAREALQTPPEKKPPAPERSAPVEPTPAAEIQREQNRIQPIRQAEAAPQVNQSRAADRLKAYLEKQQQREQLKAQALDSIRKLNELTGIRNSTATPQAMQRLDKELGRKPVSAPTQQPPRESLSQLLDRKKAEAKARQRDGIDQLKKENSRPKSRDFQRERGFD